MNRNTKVHSSATALGAAAFALGSLVTLDAQAAPCDVTAPATGPRVGLYLTQVKALDETEHDGWGEGVANDALRLVGSTSTRTATGITTCDSFEHLGDNYQDGTTVAYDRPLAFVNLEGGPTDSVASFVLVEEDWSSTNYEALKANLTSVVTNDWNFGEATATGLVVGGGLGAAWGPGGQLVFGGAGVALGFLVDIIGGAVVSSESDIFSPAALALSAPTPEQLEAILTEGRITRPVTFEGFGGKYQLTFEWRLTREKRFEGDFNADGKTDIASWRESEHTWDMSLSTGTGFRRETWTGAWGSDGPVYVGDFNGDGRDDMVIWRAANHDWTVNLSTGTGFNYRVYSGAWGSDGPTFVGDLNADGRDDLLMWRAANRDWTVNISTASGFRFEVWSGASGAQGPIYLGDFNGDGRDDVLIWRAASHDWVLNLSTGSRFNQQVRSGAWGSDGPAYVGDFNGDGRDDIAMWRAANHDWTVNLSTATAFDFRVWSGAWGSDGPARVGDFNGDGRDDIMMWRAANTDWTVNLSTGAGFAYHVRSGAWGSDGLIRVGDFDGDGRDDVIMRRETLNDWTLNLSDDRAFRFFVW